MAKTINFEKSLTEIEDIVGRLEKGNITLEESIKLYENGAKKIFECSSYLDKMEKKVNKLVTVEGKDTEGRFDFEE